MRPKVTRSDSFPGSQPVVKKNAEIFLRRAKKTGRLTHESTLQYFLATLCDADWEPSSSHLGLRYQNSPEVATLLKRMNKAKLSGTDIVSTHPNALLSVLREVLSSLPPVFPSEELLSLNPSVPDSLVRLYTSGLICSLEHECRQIVYLACKSLKKLVGMSEKQEQSLTDAIMIFSPIFFPSCNSPKSFLRAARVVLLMIEATDSVFPTHSIDYHQENLIEMIEAMECEEHYDSGFESTTFDEESGHEEWKQLDLPDTSAYYVISFED